MQINLKLSDKIFVIAKKYADARGFDTLQEFIRETLREKLFEEEVLSGIYTAQASEKALAKRWLRKEEDVAWEHLREET